MNPLGQDGNRSLTHKIKTFIVNNHLYKLKSRHCRHDQGCILHAFIGALRSFCIAYGVKTLFGMISFLLSMRKKKLPIMQIFSVFVEEDTLRFAIFPALYASIQKTILCYFRNNSNLDKKKYSFISGCVAGVLSLLALNSQRRKIWALYLATRSADSIFNALQNRQIIKRRSYYYILLYALVTLVTAYAFGFETDSFEFYLKQIYVRFSHESIRELSFRDVWNEKKKLSLGF